MRHALFLIGLGLLPTAASAAEDALAHALFFNEYCVQCHGEDKEKGEVRLDLAESFDSDLWIAIYEQLASGEMPPDDEKQPTPDERRALMDHVLALSQNSSSITTTGFRRLNRREYGHTVRDLLGLRRGTFDPGDSIYKDEVTEGFDTQAESLVISNELLIEYMAAADKSLRQALFTSDTERPPVRDVAVEIRKMQGVGGNRYITASEDGIVMRNGGKGKVYASNATRAMTAPGRYTITVTAAGVDRDLYPVRLVPAEGPIIMGFGVMPDRAESVTGGGELQRTFELKDDVDQTFTFDAWIDKGYFPYFSFVNGSSKPITQIRSGIRQRKLPSTAMKQPFAGPAVRVSEFKIEGPFYDEWPPESYRTTFGADAVPDFESASIREQLVLYFAARAFRRPVAQEELRPYLQFLAAQYAETEDGRESIIRTLAAIMSSLDFLYLLRGDGELPPFALASRLSYFLWSTMPDDELFSLANSGELLDPEVLSAQVSRLLNDPRSDRFSNSFTDQWLALDTLGSMPPDGKSPEFRVYYRGKLESAMRTETRMFFRQALRKNRSVRDFIDSDYSYLNAALAELYGVPFPGGNEFTQVSLPPDAKRGGILGHASVLTLSANGVETSPVTRGHWVLSEFLGTPPPPAPKEVPALVPDLNGAKTVRQLLDKHRTDTACAECHRQMDPLGFALEAFDPIGRLRTAYSQTMPVETDGDYKGEPFADVVELKKIMLTQLRPFARNLVVRIAEYAKGRKLVPADFILVEEILDQSAADEFLLHDLVQRIATSELITLR